MDDAEPESQGEERLIFMPGPHSDLALELAEVIVLSFNLKRLDVLWDYDNGCYYPPANN
jgi:hypothetical protein